MNADNQNGSDSSKDIGCYKCEKTFSTVREVEEHETKEHRQEELRPAEVIKIPLTDGSFVYDVHAWGWQWDESKGEMAQRLIFIACDTWGHANMVEHVLNNKQTVNIGIDA